ncbi:uncharacterized protein [Montipora foliosa]|uniref:uncharacterized protein isoform X1 n=1 Tax=Montipora foliosa TaxID=591990 RepID=UPI0035F16C1B
MLIQGKVNFFTILLLSPIFPNVCGNRRSASRNRPRRQECRDNSRTHSTCVKLINELGRQACHVDIDQIKAKLARSCTATCGFCGRPQKECRRNVYGCCWDGQTPSGDMYGIKGCPECKDHLNICGRFRKFCFGKRSENRCCRGDETSAKPLTHISIKKGSFWTRLIAHIFQSVNSGDIHILRELF